MPWGMGNLSAKQELWIPSRAASANCWNWCFFTFMSHAVSSSSFVGDIWPSGYSLPSTEPSLFIIKITQVFRSHRTLYWLKKYIRSIRERDPSIKRQLTTARINNAILILNLFLKFFVSFATPGVKVIQTESHSADLLYFLIFSLIKIRNVKFSLRTGLFYWNAIHWSIFLW